MVFQIAKEFLPIQVEPQRTVEIVVEAPDETTPATWFKDQVKIVHDGTKYEMATKERKRSLVVHDVKPEDAGDYVCQVGPHRTTARVEVLKPTEKGSLSMKVYGNVYVTTWMFLLPGFLNMFKITENEGLILLYADNFFFLKSSCPMLAKSVVFSLFPMLCLK